MEQPLVPIAPVETTDLDMIGPALPVVAMPPQFFRDRLRSSVSLGAVLQHHRVEPHRDAARLVPVTVPGIVRE